MMNGKYKIVFKTKESDNNLHGNYVCTVNNGKYDEAEPNTESHYALALVESGWDESEGAVYFEASFLKTSWQQKHREFLFEYEGTRYYK